MFCPEGILPSINSDEDDCFYHVFSGGLIPTYLVVSGLGMRNTLWALTVPVLSVPGT